jgi:hypothetical protein
MVRMAAEKRGCVHIAREAFPHVPDFTQKPAQDFPGIVAPPPAPQPRSPVEQQVVHLDHDAVAQHRHPGLMLGAPDRPDLFDRSRRVGLLQQRFQPCIIAIHGRRTEKRNAAGNEFYQPDPKPKQFQKIVVDGGNDRPHAVARFRKLLVDEPLQHFANGRAADAELERQARLVDDVAFLVCSRTDAVPNDFIHRGVARANRIPQPVLFAGKAQTALSVLLVASASPLTQSGWVLVGKLVPASRTGAFGPSCGSD